MTDSPLLTRAETAKYLGVTCETLEVWASTDRYDLPYIKVGRNVRYRLEDIMHFLKSRTIRKVNQ